MTPFQWGVLSFLVLQAFGIGVGWENLRSRVSAAEETMKKLVAAIESLAKMTATVGEVNSKDEKILEEIKEVRGEIREVRTEMREGFGYYGEAIGNAVLTINNHESWLATMEQRGTTSNTRPRMQAIKTSKPPEFLSPRARVPKLSSETSGTGVSTGQHRTYDPTKDPRNR